MKKIKYIIKKLNLSLISFKKIGKSFIINTDKGKFVIKKNTYIDKEILFDYLESRGFSFYLRPIYSDSNYEVYPYIKQSKIDRIEKYYDLVRIISYLHLKTTYYRTININKVKEKYKDIEDNISSLEKYFYGVEDSILEKEIMSPSEYLLIRNIFLFYQDLRECRKYLKEWYEIILSKKKERVVTLHNNLKADHLLVGNNTYLIDFEKTFSGSPIYDLYNLFLNSYKCCDFESLFNLYLEKYPLDKEELLYLYILLLLPEKIPLEKDELLECQVIRERLIKMDKVRTFILNNRSKQEKKESP